MQIKRILAAGVAIAMSVALLAGCGASKETTNDATTQEQASTAATAETTASTTTEATATQAPAEEGKYQDGIYFSQGDAFDEKSGWKDVVTLEVKDGKIVRADWNGAHVDAGKDKKTASKDGDYGMKAGGASSEWHEQAEKVEAYLIEKQDPAAITYKDDAGATDAISGATMKVKSFFDLAQKALAAGPAGSGNYKDGTYFKEAADFDAKTGWKDTASFTVINGFIVAADWDGVNKNGGDTKDKVSKDGKYGMKAGGASSEWHEQAEKVEAYILETQDPAKIEYKDAEGHTDAISGATMNVKGFFALAQEALAAAK